MGNTGEEDLQNKPKTIKKILILKYISKITWNVNGLNALTKRHRLAGCIEKPELYIYYLQETHFKPRDTYRLKLKAWKSKEVAKQVSDRLDFRRRTGDFSSGSVVRKSPVNARDTGLIPGPGRFHMPWGQAWDPQLLYSLPQKQFLQLSPITHIHSHTFLFFNIWTQDDPTCIIHTYTLTLNSCWIFPSIVILYFWLLSNLILSFPLIYKHIQVS